MSPQPAVVFPAPKMLDVKLGGRMIHNVSEDPGAINCRLADQRIRAALIEQDPAKFQLATYLGGSVIDPDHVSFADPILSRTVFENCIHTRLPSPLSFTMYQLFKLGNGIQFDQSNEKGFPERVQDVQRSSC
jgi:hypothetical protein